MRVTSAREPWYTLLLGVDLSATVVVIEVGCNLFLGAHCLASGPGSLAAPAGELGCSAAGPNHG
jgi:hypothetical protein